nr:acyltransferase family protein [Companilactobacillus kimchiensis]
MELLRIISMLLITLHHFSLWAQGTRSDRLILQGKVGDAFKSLIYLPLGDIGVYIFVMITGFYLGGKVISNKKSIKKVLMIYAQLYFYNLLFLIVGLHYHLPLNNFPKLSDPLNPFNRIPNVMMSIFPIAFNHYWFVTAFVLLMLLTPYINQVLIKIDKKSMELLLAILIISNGLFPLLNNNVASETVGLGIVVTSYVVGAFIRRFIPKNPKMFLIGTLLLFTNTALIYLVAYYDIIVLKNRYIKIYTGLFALLAAAGLFLIFINFKPNYNFYINNIARHIFAVYLITENIFIINPLWKYFTFDQVTNLYLLNVYGFLSVVVIMIGACTLDILRSNIFRICHFQFKSVTNILEYK